MSHLKWANGALFCTGLLLYIANTPAFAGSEKVGDEHDHHSANAHSHHPESGHGVTHPSENECADGCAMASQHHHNRADATAPIGVMGDHLHEADGWMFSYRYMHMDMAGSRKGTSSLTPDEIATTAPNIFFGQPMQPPTLRVVPIDMTMDMHMFSVMYAPSNNLTLMLMTDYLDKQMTHVTYAGGMGASRLGQFETEAKGFGDLRLSALVRLFDAGSHHFHLNLGLSAPTGKIGKQDVVLTPMGMTPTLTLPYAMQIGAGTWNLLPGVTYTSQRGDVTWGAQYGATLTLGDNDQDYAFGDKHKFTFWSSYSPTSWASLSVRLAGEHAGDITGRGARIMAPVQTADPDNYGGKTVDLFLGLNLLGEAGALKDHRLAFEFGLPLHRDLNGPQMEQDWNVMIGYQKSF